MVLLILPIISDHGHDKDEKSFDSEENEELTKALLEKGFIKLFDMPFEQSGSFHQNNVESKDFDEEDEDDHHDEKDFDDYKNGKISMYGLYAEVSGEKKLTKLAYLPNISQDALEIADYSKNSSDVIESGTESQEISGSKSMFTVVKTSAGVYSMSASKIESDCLKMMSFTSVTNETPETSVESGIVYVTIPREERRILQEKNSNRHKGDYDEKDDLPK